MSIAVTEAAIAQPPLRRRVRSPTMCWPGLRRSRSVCRRNISTISAARSCSSTSRRFRNIIRPAPRSAFSKPMPAEIAKLIPADAAVVEFGAGSAAKTRILLRAAPQISAYVPVDISGEFLAGTAARLQRGLAGPARHAGQGRFHASPSRCPRRSAIGLASAFFQARPSGISSPTRPMRCCAMPPRCSGPARCSSSGSIWSRTRTCSPRPIMTAPASRRRSTSICSTRINRELGGDFNLAKFPPSRLLQSGPAPGRDASRQRGAPEGPGLRQVIRIPPRRNHPHREQLQIYGRIVPQLRGLRRVGKPRNLAR